MDEGSQGIIQVDANPEIRQGVYADLVMAFTKDGVTRLDFIYIDSPERSQGESGAVLSSRVLMTNDNLIHLKEMLERHTSTWADAEGPVDAE